MRIIVAAAKVLALLSVFMAIPACPHPVAPTPGKPGVIDCTLQSVRDNGLPLIPKVNDCLTNESWQECLFSLIQPAIGITEEVVACVVNSSGRAFANAASLNAKDAVSNMAAAHARQYIEDHGYSFGH